ncbi:hypothetical protein G6027_11965, partial [Dietzia sp. SLG310A2-38A2]|nr:hypothetical protein [Dietzia sp. SLG310A2-38A2]
AGWVFLALAALALSVAAAVAVNRRFRAGPDGVAGPQDVAGEPDDPLGPDDTPDPDDTLPGPYPHPATAADPHQPTSVLEQRDPR